MNVNDVVLYSIIISAAVLAYLALMAHREQKMMLQKLKGSGEKLGKLSNLVKEVEKVEHQMHKAAVEKVDRRNLDLIIKETLEFLNEKRSAAG